MQSGRNPYNNLEDNYALFTNEQLKNELLNLKNKLNHTSSNLSQFKMPVKAKIPTNLQDIESQIENFSIVEKKTNNQTVKRPSTANKPKSQMSVGDHNLANKKFDFTQKSFKTVKKCDPVARINALKNGWKKDKYLKNTDINTRSRKLDLENRFQIHASQQNTRYI